MCFTTIVEKLVRQLERLWWAPVEVLVFHAVSDLYDSRRNKRVDWSQTDVFKNHVRLLKSRYRFVSLDEAGRRLHRWCPRRERLAVLTCDDGYASVLDVLPFLESERVPVTLFVNPKYLDGVSRREGYAEEPQYMTHDQLWALTSEWVTVGMHGYAHDDATVQTAEEFELSVERCVEALQRHPRYIPFFAYTWGRHTEATQRMLWQKGIVPVGVDGNTNRHYHGMIDRRPMDSHYWNKIWNKMTNER